MQQTFDQLEAFVYDLCKEYGICLSQYSIDKCTDLTDGHKFTRLTIWYKGLFPITPPAFDALCKATKAAGYTLTLRHV